MSQTKTLSLILLAVSLPVLAGCTGTSVALGGEALGIYSTKPEEPPPADLSLQMPQHESWCYETMADIECFAHPQPGGPARLIMVDPPSRYPLTPQAHEEAVIEARRP